MDKQIDFGSALMNGVTKIVDHVFVFLPNIIGALVLLIIGWLLARLLRVITWRGDRLPDKVSLHLLRQQAGRLHVATASPILGNIVFSLVLLFFATAATERHPKAVIIASEPLSEERSYWTAAPINHPIVITPELHVRMLPIS